MQAGEANVMILLSRNLLACIRLTILPHGRELPNRCRSSRLPDIA